MKLKYVELYGFKSFAEKTKLHFNKEISAIVGPNGSGKSNIADAIKWVLGEQSAKSLRGSNMQDVIFSGTDKRKPMNMAQVSLILDNSDKSLPIAFDEVNVTRRVYRTGESEYLLNKATVRLKDIKELFLDTGLGKDGYSMIGQGKIDEILNGKNEDRRYIFDEACGISKNKYKKSESEKKLVKNEENLKFLLQELKLKKQEVDILQKQSENAKEGIKLTSKLEKLELNLLFKSIEKYSLDLIKDKENLIELNLNLNKEIDILENLEQNILPLENKIEEDENRLLNLRSQQINKDKKISTISSEINVLNEKIKFFNQDKDRIILDLKNKNKKLSDFNNIRENKIKENKDLLEKKENINENYKEIKEQVGKFENEISILTNEKIKINDFIEKNKNILSNLQIDKSTKEKLDISNEKLKENYLSEILSLKSLILEKNKNLNEKENNIKSINELLDKNGNYINESIDKRTEYNLQIKSLLNKKDIIKDEYIKLESKKDLLEKQYKSYDGYYRSVQNLLQTAQRDNNISDRIVGVLADLIQVEDEYKVAVDVALGSSLQNIVINNEDDGKYLINYIKKNNIGRITFLPISKISGNRHNVNHPKSIGTLNDLVKNDNKIDGIINHFLSRTILVSNMDDAIIVSKETKGFRIITLDGEIISSWGSMVGGNTFKKESNSLLNRKKELDEITKQLKIKKSEIEKINTRIENSKNLLSEILYTLENLDNKNIELLSQKNSIISSIQEVKLEIGFNNKRLSEYEEGLNKINQELQIKDFSQIDKIKSDIDEKVQRLNEINTSLEKHLNQKLESDKKLVKINSEKDVVVRDLSILENEIENIKIEIENLESDIKIGIKSSEKISTELKNSIDILDELKDELNNLESTTDRDVLDIDMLNKKIVLDKQSIKSDRVKINQLKENISENEKEKYRIELKIENNEDKIKNLRLDYMETYSLSDEEFNLKLENLEYINATKKEVIDIKNRLSEIGYFNYESIEEYVKVEEEYSFMQKQYEDLVISRNDIIKMIKNIERDMKETFEKTFKKIQIRFNEIFSTLFNGGEATIKLDDDDILTAGIDITARPPGKSLKNITLLSGGEKALTAVALLFSIFEINPAPFCVLDEIDAALDEGNIRRYFEYLKSLVDKSQFIIITHRKQSMEMASILYGVTIEEQGVSKVVTLMLEDFDEKK